MSRCRLACTQQKAGKVVWNGPDNFFLASIQLKVLSISEDSLLLDMAGTQPLIILRKTLASSADR